MGHLKDARRTLSKQGNIDEKERREALKCVEDAIKLLEQVIKRSEASQERNVRTKKRVSYFKMW